MRSYESMRRLIVELEGDNRELVRLLDRNATAWARIEAGADDPVDWGALGFTIQTLYGVLENYFLRISRFFENDLPAQRWHQALVDRVALDIGGVRPALLPDRRTREEVRELVRFRHRLRNLYGEDLDPHKTEQVQRIVVRFFARFPELHRAFIAKLAAIGDEL